MLVVAAAPILIILAAYARWWWIGERAPENDPLPLGWACAALAEEVVALTLTGARALWPHPPAGESITTAEHPPIVLIAGGPLGPAALDPLRQRLTAHGWPTTLFRPSSWRIPTADAAAQLDAFLRAGRHRGTVLIAYGSAGLILRYYLRRYPASGIRRVATIGTPHQETEAPAVGTEPTSLLRQLTAGDRVPQQFEVIAIYSDFDAFITPAIRAYYPGAFNIEVRGVGHFALARSARVFQLLVENLERPPTPAPSAES